MAKAKKSTESSNSFRAKPKKTNKGVHAKSKESKNKNSKNYKKVYVGQGK
jgi:hypothetical protein